MGRRVLHESGSIHKLEQTTKKSNSKTSAHYAQNSLKQKHASGKK